MTPLLLTGHEALAHIGSAPFQAKWTALLGACPWASACQHPDFVLPWYALYASRFLPVVVVHEAGDGTLAGFFPLALDGAGRRLTGAGERQAEYQVWLQPPDADAAFIQCAIRAVRARFPRADLALRYLPAGTPLAWLGAMRDAIRDAGRWYTLRSTARPLMHIDPVAMARQRSKKNHRQNFNRLSRLGEVRLEKVVAHDHFLHVIDTLCDQYDFRQAALYRDRPFATDAAKTAFYIALHKRGLLHVTLLTVGGDIAASHIGLVSEGRAVHLGINTGNPTLSAHSPGNLLLSMLGVQLAAERMPLLDLTPGGDRYKEHFASGHDVVSELTIYSSAWGRLATATRQGCKTLAKALLDKAGWRPHDVSALVGRIKAWKLAGLASRWKPGRPSPGRDAPLLRYAGAHNAADACPLPVSRNRLPDMLAFEAAGSACDYHAFLHTAMKRMERGEACYSVVRDNRLGILCWVSVDMQGKAVVIADVYVHRSCASPALLVGFIAGVLVDIQRRHPHAEIVYKGGPGHDHSAIMARCGFQNSATGSPNPASQEPAPCSQAN